MLKLQVYCERCSANLQEGNVHRCQKKTSGPIVKYLQRYSEPSYHIFAKIGVAQCNDPVFFSSLFV